MSLIFSPSTKIFDLENKNLPGKQMWMWFPHMLLQLPSRVIGPPIPDDFGKTDQFYPTFLNSTLLQDDGWYFYNEVLSDLYILNFQHMSRIKHILPQLRHMEHRMKICQLRGQNYLISHRLNPPRDLIRTKKLRRKLPWVESPSHTSGLGHPQEHVIFDRELQGSPPAVRISLLSALWSLHFVSYHPHLLSGLCWHEKPRWFASWRFDEDWMKLFSTILKP